MEDKKEIRRIVRQRIKDMTPEARESAATKIFQIIESRNEFQASQCIALFAAMTDEVTTAKALHNWREMGKHIVVPRVEGDVMRFYDYDPEQMTTGAFGIEEPTSDTEIPAEAIDLMIVPARAFTREGLRLGRGGGFYDKFLAAQPDHPTVALCYGFQVVPALPTEEFDIPVDCVLWA